MLRLVSLNGENTTQSLYKNHPVYPSIGKYIVELKDYLGIEAEMAKLDSQGSRYQLLQALSYGKDYLPFENAIYLPMRSNKKLWGFVKLKNSKNINPNTIKKAVQRLKKCIPNHLYSDMEDESSRINPLVALVLNVEGTKAYKLVLDHFHKDKYASFINLSEWINLDQPFSLKYLREFRNSLFYIHEVMELSRSQRATLALYSMLPTSMQQNALVVSSKLGEAEITKTLSSERGFLNAFLSKKIELESIKPKRPLS